MPRRTEGQTYSATCLTNLFRVRGTALACLTLSLYYMYRQSQGVVNRKSQSFFRIVVSRWYQRVYVAGRSPARPKLLVSKDLRHFPVRPHQKPYRATPMMYQIAPAPMKPHTNSPALIGDILTHLKGLGNHLR